MRHTFKPVPVLVVAALVVCMSMALAACGGGSSSSSSETSAGSEGSGESTGSETANSGEAAQKVKVAMNPLAGYAQILVGVEKGFFTEAGVEVEAEVTPENSSTLIPLVLHGQYQFVTGLSFNFMTAHEQGLDFQTVSSSAPLGGTKVDALLVDGSKVKSAQDLEGQPVCTAALGSAQEFFIKAWMEEEGADSSTVKPVAVPFPAQIAAVKSGRCDVTATEAPFVEIGEKEGLTALAGYSTIGGGASSLGGMLWATQEWLEGNGEAAEAVVVGMEKSAEYANENPEAVREALVNMAGMSKEEAQATEIPKYETTVDVEGGQETAALMEELGFLKSPISFEELVWSGAPTKGK